MLGANTLKNMAEGGDAIIATLKKTPELKLIANKLKSAKKIYAIGCGSSYWAAYLLTELLKEGKIASEAVHSSHFYLLNYPLNRQAAVIAFSQSGTTTETIKALARAKRGKAKTAAIVNATDSLLAKKADHVFVTPAGREEEVIATKSLDAALIAAHLLAANLTKQGAKDLRKLSECYETVFGLNLSSALAVLKSAKHGYALGIGADLAVAGETAVKFGEAAGIQITALPALEISHGPKAFIKDLPVFIIAVDERFTELYRGVIEEIKTAGGVSVLYTRPELKLEADIVFNLPGSRNLARLAAVKLTQHLSLSSALAKGIDPDNPPGLVKSVVRENFDK